LIQNNADNTIHTADIQEIIQKIDSLHSVAEVLLPIENALPTLVLYAEIQHLSDKVHSLLKEKNSPETEPEISPEPLFSTVQEFLYRITERHSDVNALLLKLGYSPILEATCEHITSHLRRLLTVRIPDIEVFTQALQKAQEQWKEQIQPLNDSASYQYGEYLTELRAIPSDSIEQYMNNQPQDKKIPFVEILPTIKEGNILWRSPIELSLLQRHPLDKDEFLRLLRELENTILQAPVPPAREPRDAVAREINRLRQAVHKPTAYIPTLLGTLEVTLRDCIHFTASDTVGKSREKAMQFIHALWTLQSTYTVLKKNKINNSVNVPQFIEQTRKTSALYAEIAWLYTPTFSLILWEFLLFAELLQLQGITAHNGIQATALLQALHNEAAQGICHPQESRRKLHSLEEQGIVVSSLLYSVLSILEKKRG
jgi:hypothetical protein